LSQGISRGSLLLAQPERACPNVMPQYCTGQSASCFLDSGACKEHHYPDQTKGDRQAVGASRALALGKAINGYGAGCALTSSDNQGAATSSGAGSCLHGCGREWCRLVQLRPRVRPTSQGRPHFRRWRTVQRGRRFHWFAFHKWVGPISSLTRAGQSRDRRRTAAQTATDTRVIKPVPVRAPRCSAFIDFGPPFPGSGQLCVRVYVKRQAPQSPTQRGTSWDVSEHCCTDTARGEYMFFFAYLERGVAFRSRLFAPRYSPHCALRHRSLSFRCRQAASP